MNILPRDDLKKQEILSLVAHNFMSQKEYTEEEVNFIIKEHSTDDHVLFRRELVNFGYLGKDSYKGIYWLKKTKLSEDELKIIKENKEKISRIQ